MEPHKDVTDMSSQNSGLAKSGERQATERDVLLCYRVLHGREPENRQAIDVKTSGTVRDLVAAGLASDEFNSTLLMAMARGEPPVHARTSPGPGPLDLEWAAANLPLEQVTRPRLSLVRSWREFFAILFNDQAFHRSVPAFGSDPALAAAVLEATGDPGGTREQGIVGAIELCLGADIKGWAADPTDLDNPVTLEILADGEPVGIVVCDQFRGDLKPILGTTGNFGFQFALPPSLRRLRPNGFRVTAVDSRRRRAIGGARHVDLSRNSDLSALAEMNRRLAEIEASLKSIRDQIPSVSLLTSYSLNDYDDYVHHAAALGEFRRAGQQVEMTNFHYRPVLSVVLRREDPDPARFEDSLRTVSRQTYDRWELLICVDPAVSAAESREIVVRLFRGDPRVKLATNGGEPDPSGCAYAAVATAAGEYVCFLDAGDELSDDALFNVVAALQRRRYSLIYSDEDRFSVDASGRRHFHSPYFKPDFDWDLLIGHNYLCRLLVAETAIVARTGGYRPRYGGLHEYDLVLRCLDEIGPGGVGHVCSVAYHRRTESEPDIGKNAEQDEALRLACITDHLQRRSVRAHAEPLSDAFAGPRPGSTRLVWALPEEAPPVSVIIPTHNRADLLRRCLAALMPAIEAYRGSCEIVVVDNASTDPDARALIDSLKDRAARVLPYYGPFNWSTINNEAARAASGAVLVFLNNDAFMRDADSLTQLVAQAMRDDVGAVGARLLYENGDIQHAGILLGVDGHSLHDGLGRHAMDGGYFDRHHLAHQVSAVTGACLATRKIVFDEVRGFDPGFAVTCNDLDYCLRLGDLGYKTIYDPAVVLYHLESRTRGDPGPDAKARQSNEEMRFRARWRAKVRRDPFYNPHFERHFAPFARIRLIDAAEERQNP